MQTKGFGKQKKTTQQSVLYYLIQKFCDNFIFEGPFLVVWVGNYLIK